MKEWNILAKIKEDDKEYVILLDHELKKFFLKINEEGTYSYPILEEYKKLHYKYDFINNTTSVYFNKKILLDAKVYIGTKLVPLAFITTMIFGLSGCDKTTDAIEEYNKNGVVLEIMDETSNLYKVSSVDLSKISPNSKLNETISEDTFGVSYAIQCVPSEFSKYTGTPQPTWSDIYITLEDSSMDDNIKQIIYDGLKKLEVSGLHIDLSVLNYNLKRMTIKYVDEIEGPTDAGGYFDAITGEVFICKEYNQNDSLSKYVLLHEILGHGLTNAYIPENGGIMCDLGPHYYCIEEGEITEGGPIELFAAEAIADIIGIMASDRKLSSSIGYGYATQIYSLQAMMDCLEIDISDVANNGIIYLVENMKQNGIENPYLYIRGLNVMHKIAISQETSYFESSFNSELLTSFFDEWAKYKSNHGATHEEIKEVIERALDSSNVLKMDEEMGFEIICTGKNLINVTSLKNTIMSIIESYKKTSKSK